MRFPFGVMLSLVVAACGATGPQVTPALTCPQAETPLPEPASISAQPDIATASLDGTWFIVEMDDSDIEARIEVSGERAELHEDGPRTSEPMIGWVTREPEPGHFSFRFTDAGEEFAVHALLENHDAAVVWVEGDDDLAVAYRGGPLPVWLTGTWELNVNGEIGQLTVEDGRFRLSGDRSEEGEATGAGPSAIVLFDDERGVLLELRRLNDNVVVVWAHADDDVQYLYRPGMDPGWGQEPRRNRTAAHATEAIPAP